MLDELRSRITALISQYQICVISTGGSNGEWAVLARYENQGLEISCLLPRGSDALYYLDQDPHVIVIIRDSQADRLRWVQVRGVACLLDSKQDDCFISVRIKPERIDLLDERYGWSRRETLDL